MGCDDAVWRESADSEVLRSLFGYLPTLHDARIRAIEIEWKTRTVVLVVDYSDVPEGGAREIDVRLRISFFEVSQLDLPLEAIDILDFKVKKVREGVETRALMSGGDWLVILSSGLEISLERVGPEVGGTDARLVLR